MQLATSDLSSLHGGGGELLPDSQTPPSPSSSQMSLVVGPSHTQSSPGLLEVETLNTSRLLYSWCYLANGFEVNMAIGFGVLVHSLHTLKGQWFWNR